jgi:hypothetical protein
MKCGEQVQIEKMCEDAKCVVDQGYIGVKEYTIWAGGRRISVTRFTEEAAWEDAYDRLMDKKPMLEDWK